MRKETPEERRPPDPWSEWRGDAARWTRPFLFFEWLCEWAVYRLRRWAFIELLELGGRLAIVVSVVSFAWNYRAVQENQRKAKHHQAWQIINSAAGKTGSGGRMEALEDLVSDDVIIGGVDLAGAELRRIGRAGANLDRARLWGANLNRADLTGAHLRAAELGDANLTGTDLEDANLMFAEFSDANLTGAKLKNANLRRAFGSGANLTGADLSFADLEGAFLRDVNLANAELREANLTNVYLQGANLTGADMFMAKLKDTGLTDTNLQNVKHLDCGELKRAYNWEAAFREENLACGADIPPTPTPTPADAKEGDHNR